MHENFKKLTALGASAVIIASAIAPTAAQAAETTQVSQDNEKGVSKPTAEELAALVGVDSNNDQERRAALEEKYGIKLTEKMIWEDKAGKVFVDEKGVESKYTSHAEMKELGFYAVNANRQELIQYAIETGDWQPYRAFEAEGTPAYFEKVDGKYEYNKVYYGKLLQSAINSYPSQVANTNGEEKEALAKSHAYFLKEYTQKFNDAPGITPYIVGLNHRNDLAKEFGVKMADNKFFDSKWNSSSVMEKGIFSDKEVVIVDENDANSFLDSDQKKIVSEALATEATLSSVAALSTFSTPAVDLKGTTASTKSTVSELTESTPAVISVEDDKTSTDKVKAESTVNADTVSGLSKSEESSKADDQDKATTNTSKEGKDKEVQTTDSTESKEVEEGKDENPLKKEVKPPTKEELDALTGLDSNDDDERRKALEEEFGIKLTDDMVWEDKAGQTSVNPDGTESKYTSHDEMKSLGFYAVNANRQELIQYGIKTGNWYPYREFEAKDTPAYFERVDDKLEYNKVYYGNFLESRIFDFNANYYRLEGEEKEQFKKEFDRYLEEYIPKFKNAPGIVPYVVGLNHREDVAAEMGVPMADSDYFDSKWNYPTVKSQGKFAEKQTSTEINE